MRSPPGALDSGTLGFRPMGYAAWDLKEDADGQIEETAESLASAKTWEALQMLLKELIDRYEHRSLQLDLLHERQDRDCEKDAGKRVDIPPAVPAEQPSVLPEQPQANEPRILSDRICEIEPLIAEAKAAARNFILAESPYVFGETLEDIHDKLKAATSAGVSVMICGSN